MNGRIRNWLYVAAEGLVAFGLVWGGAAVIALVG